MHALNRVAPKLPPEQGILSQGPQADIMGSMNYLISTKC